jgi:hypothetical protein
MRHYLVTIFSGIPFYLFARSLLFLKMSVQNIVASVDVGGGADLEEKGFQAEYVS